MPHQDLFHAFFATTVGAGVSDTNRCALRLLGRPIKLARHDTLTLDRVCFVRSGHTKLSCLMPNGQDYILGFPRPGALLYGESGSAPARQLTALQNCLILGFPTEKFVDTISLDPVASRALLDESAAQLDAQQTHAARLATLTACGRVAAFLSKMAEESGKTRRGALRIVLPMSRAEIGDHLGLTIETTSRCISRLRREGLLTCPSRDEILVLDRLALDRFSG